MATRLGYIRRRSWVSFFARLALASVLLLLLFTRVGFASVLETLRLIRPRWLVLVFIISLVMHLVQACQMSFGLGPLGMRFGVRDLFRIKLISSFYTLLLPGDLVSAGVAWYKLSRSDGKGIEAGTLLLYFRLVDTLVLLTIGLVGLCFDPVPISSAFRLVVAAMVVGVFALLLPFLSPASTRLIARLGSPLLRSLSLPISVRRNGRTARNAVLAFHRLSNVRSGIVVLSLSLLNHALGVASYYLLARAVGIPLPLFLLGWIRTFAAIVQMVPASLAGLGVREASMVLLLGRYGIPEPQALGFSLGIFAVMVLAGSVGGLLEGWDLCLGKPRFATTPSEQDEGAAAIPR